MEQAAAVRWCWCSQLRYDGAWIAVITVEIVGTKIRTRKDATRHTVNYWVDKALYIAIWWSFTPLKVLVYWNGLTKGILQQSSVSNWANSHSIRSLIANVWPAHKLHIFSLLCRIGLRSKDHLHTTTFWYARSHLTPYKFTNFNTLRLALTVSRGKRWYMI